MNNELLTILFLYISLIIITIMVVPYVLYKTIKHDKNTFSIWLESIGFSITELIFVFINLCLILVFNQFHMLIGLILALYIIVYFNYKTKQKDVVVRKNKNYLLAFIIVFIPYIALLLIYNTGFINNQNLLLINSLYLLPINLTILLMFFFKIRFKDFKWNMSIRTILIVLLLYLILKPLTLVLFDIDQLSTVTWKSFCLNFAHNIYYPAFIEEIIFRGILLTGLILYGFSNKKANISQAILFGIIHIINREHLDLAALFSTSMQVYLGYLFGKLYLSTKTLTPNILLHALFNVI